MALTRLGNCSYNGFTFSAYMELVGLHAEPVYDQAQRTVVYTNWTITIRDRLTSNASDTLDTTIETARQQLMVPGGALTLNSKGFGNLDVNVGARKDVMWGPKPKSFNYRIKGRDLAGEIVWTVQVSVPESCASPTYTFRLMESLFRVSYQVDFSGYSTRTVSGFIRIPQTRTSAATRTLSDSADNYRQLIDPVCPVGFRRTVSSFTLDESKCRLDYSITDVEMPPTAPPPGVIECDASHSVSSSQLTPSTSIWTGAISASYEVAKDQPKSIAYGYFIALLVSRANYAIANASKPGSVLFTNLTLNDSSIYGKKAATFSASYTFTTTLQTILSASGLWQPVPNSDYALWRASLANGIFSPDGRSYAGLRFNTGDDMIVDLCSGNTSVLTAGGVLGQNSFVAGAAMQNSYPAPAGSFMDYQLNARIVIDDNVVELKALPTNPFAPAAPAVPADLNNVPAQGAAADPAAGRIVNNVVPFAAAYAAGQTLTNPQQRAAPSLSLVMSGRAIRAGYPIAPPMVQSVGGTPVVPANREEENYFEQGQVASYFDVPIIAARWNLRWSIPMVPAGSIGVPPGPFSAGA